MNPDAYKPKYIDALSKDSADIFLYGDIGSEKINGQVFAEEINMLNEMGVSEINVHISSSGGDVVEGLAIFHAILNSEAHVNTLIEGVAASMAGVIAMAGDTITMTDASNIMIHSPFSPAHNSDDPEVANALNALKETLLTIFKNRTSITDSKMGKIMDEETWLTAKEALDQGFIDSIKKTKKAKPQSRIEIMNLLNKYNNNTQPTKSNSMKTLAVHFNLSAEATAEAILAEINKVEDKLTASTERVTEVEGELATANTLTKDLQDKVDAFEASAEEVVATQIEEVIDSGVKEGKLEESAKEDLVARYKGDFAGIKSLVSGIRVAAPSISNGLKDSVGVNETSEAIEGVSDKFKGMSIREIEKKDSKYLETLMNNQPEVYEALHVAYYGTK